MIRPDIGRVQKKRKKTLKCLPLDIGKHVESKRFKLKKREASINVFTFRGTVSNSDRE